MSIEIVGYKDGNIEGLVLQRDANNQRKVRGLASVYYNGTPGTEYALDKNVVERIAPGAFDHLLTDDVIACRDHDTKLIVGRNGKTLKLWTTARGLEYEVDLKNTTAGNDLWEDVQAGNIKGSSFKAVVSLNDKNAVEWSKDKGKDVLTIKRFDRLRDVSCVCSPAYLGTDCTAVWRSLDEHNAIVETLKRLERIKSILGA